MAAIVEVKYFNSFLLKKVLNASDELVWNGSTGLPTVEGGYPQAGDNTNDYNWAIEESRIRGGFNNTQLSLGARAYLVEEEPNGITKKNSLIYSGIYNSRTGINNTNVFSIGKDITKSVDPANGSIQKLYAEDTALIIFQENKVSRGPIDKDIIYSAEGGGAVVASNAVIGNIQPYSGNFGISTNPESFAVYGFQKYFTDKNRNVVLRLSVDGLTPISEYGMSDFFRDELSKLDSNVYGKGKLMGSFDIYNKQYVLSIQPNETDRFEDDSYKTLVFDDNVKGWVSFYSYKPQWGFSLRNKFYTLAPKEVENNTFPSIWEHNSGTRNNFYSTTTPSSITFIFNSQPSLCKSFKTVNYEGSNGWKMDSFVSDMTGADKINNDWEYSESSANTILSYTEGAYDNYGNSYPSTLIPPISRAGFNRKENKYFSNLVNNSQPALGEILWGNTISGVKGYYATVAFKTDLATDPGKTKELFAVSTEYVESSY
jgi:hypothetical protein